LFKSNILPPSILRTLRRLGILFQRKINCEIKFNMRDTKISPFETNHQEIISYNVLETNLIQMWVGKHPENLF
jgi:hypothetical protein